MFLLYFNQCLQLFLVGYTFDAEHTPVNFQPRWQNWVGDYTDPVGDWRLGPYYSLLPEKKGV